MAVNEQSAAATVLRNGSNISAANMTVVVLLILTTQTTAHIEPAQEILIKMTSHQVVCEFNSQEARSTSYQGAETLQNCHRRHEAGGTRQGLKQPNAEHWVQRLLF